MNRNLFWKSLLVIFVVAWSLWEIYPPRSRNLIDEFENQAAFKDTNLTAIISEARALNAATPTRAFENLQQAISTNDIRKYFPSVKIPADGHPTRVILHDLQREAAGQIKLGLDLQGGSSFLVGLDTNALELTEAKERTLSHAVEVLRKRVDAFGVAEPIIQPAGENRILIQLPGLSEAEMDLARKTIQQAAFLEFRMVHSESDTLLRQGIGAPGHEILRLVDKDPEGRERVTPFLVGKKPERGLTGKFVSRAGVIPGQYTGAPEIILDFNDEGAALFAEITTQHTGRFLAIVLDGELYSAPRISEPIRGGSARITGDFSVGEAYALANVLENPLEVPVQIENEFSVEPSLGKDSIRSGITAALIGTIVVAGFMLVYYMFAGLLANVALLLNLIVLLGVMCSIDAVLTLPGIAGIVLTIGMAVDANVLIFERIREEFDAGKSLRGAISAGYGKAFSTIFDANVTTLIASIILIFLGTGPVKGFGVTLTIGVTVSMFTALVVTRLIFDACVAKGILKRLRMLRVLGQTNIDFLRWSKPAFIISWALVLVGIGYGISRGADVLGVDFRGGDQLTYEFQERVPQDQLRQTVASLDVGDALIQYQRDPSGVELLQITSAYDTGGKIADALQQAHPGSQFNAIQTFNVGPAVGQEILKTAVLAMLLALFGILIYVALRYEFSFAVGALIAVIHDILMTMGWFCLTGREFSAPMVAAILTIIGFSINDTIVIFDRIREDLKLGLRGSFKDLMNLALNQTLSRTIITSGTTFLATASLYLFGGPVINDFAFTFLVGIITGTYSSIFVACAIVLWWHKGERPQPATQPTLDGSAPAKA